MSSLQEILKTLEFRPMGEILRSYSILRYSRLPKADKAGDTLYLPRTIREEDEQIARQDQPYPTGYVAKGTDKDIQYAQFVLNTQVGKWMLIGFPIDYDGHGVVTLKKIREIELPYQPAVIDAGVLTQQMVNYINDNIAQEDHFDTYLRLLYQIANAVNLQMLMPQFMADRDMNFLTPWIDNVFESYSHADNEGEALKNFIKKITRTDNPLKVSLYKLRAYASTLDKEITEAHSTK